MNDTRQWCHDPDCEGLLELVSEKIDGSITHLLFRCNKCGVEKSQVKIHGESNSSPGAGQTTVDQVPDEDVTQAIQRLLSEREKGL